MTTALAEPEVEVTPAQHPQARSVPVVAPPRKVERVPTEACPDRERLLYDLTDEALKRGISDYELRDIELYGTCANQVEQRIGMLERWLDKHPVVG